ncbi:DUF397 domain-containing protein [Streptomyces capitiformicae]|uniref:DUF397 domain-containing protein n=1 Tax=Streptomyces capitiformicae TaxID=2014920 RepID=A0A918Z0X6_9ACTN|nr:DUF397 domain-containing protein [Streptomyces capitiformicae]GHE31375.1 hypothetical protein GCM10017771_47730 [Streptomyces capitiformicae]
MNPRWQKSSYCSEGASCIHIAQTWQKSSHCSEGDSCVHISTGPATIHLTESADPTQAILNATPTAFDALLHVLKLDLNLAKEALHV